MATDPHLEKSTNGRSFKVPTALRTAMDLAVRLSPDLAAGLAVRLFTTPRRHRRPAREVSLLERAQPLPRSAGEPAAWRWGSGPPVLLVHGWEGRGAQLGSFVDPLVSSGFSVVAFDAPAHGATPGRSAHLLDFRDSLRRVANRVGPLHAIVAHSFGAPAAELALDQDVSARCAVFVAPPARFDGVDTFARVFELPDEVKAGMQRKLEAQVGLRFADVDPLAIAHRMHTPLLIVHDLADGEVAFASGEALAAAWPGAALRATEGLGHRRVLRDPDVVRAAVDFIAGFADERPALVELERALDLDHWPER